MCQNWCICSAGSLLDVVSLICTGRCEINLFNHRNGSFLKLTAQQHQVMLRGLTSPTSQSVILLPIIKTLWIYSWSGLTDFDIVISHTDSWNGAGRHVAAPPPCNSETHFSTCLAERRLPTIHSSLTHRAPVRRCVGACPPPVSVSVSVPAPRSPGSPDSKSSAQLEQLFSEQKYAVHTWYFVAIK